MLLPRLYPMHPLKALVQTVAPLSLAAVLCVTVPPVIWFMNSQMTAERATLMNMASRLDDAASRLHMAAQFPYAGLKTPADYRANRDRLDAALSILRESPETLKLPDETRWRAAGVLERDGRLHPPGGLDRASRELIDAVHEVVTTDQIPELRTGRYLPYGPNLDRYQLSDNIAKRTRGQLLFGPPAELGSVYYSGAAMWFKHTMALGSFQTKDYYRTRMADVDERLTDLNGRVSTVWWAGLLTPHSRASLKPDFNLSQVFETGLSGEMKPMADVHYWFGTHWGGFARAAREGPCRIVRQRVSNERPISAPAAALTEEQQRSGRTFYLGAKYDAEGVAQCFAYHPPIDDSLTPLVLELRLEYEAKDLQALAKAPCDIDVSGKCWTLPMPSDAAVANAEMFIDIPKSRLGQANYPSEVWQAFSNSVDRLGAGPVQAVAPPALVTQGEEQQVVLIKFR
jgi:hypothetical protein